MKKFLFIILSCLTIFIILNLKDEDIPEDTQSPGNEVTDNNQSEEQNNEILEEQAQTYLNNITYNVSLDKEIEKVIVEYFDVYYKSMKELKEYDMTYLFSNGSEDSLINQAAVSLLVKIRTLKPNDLRLSSVKYDLEITDVSTEGNKVNVSILEDNYLNFSFMSEIESRIYNIKNEFTLEKTGTEYKIVKYNKVQDFYVMITDKYTSGGQEVLDNIIEDYLELIEEKIIEDKNAYDEYVNGNIKTKACDHSFDRDKALNYALKWVETRNSEWVKYSSNCQNYASQVLYEGGIPMDYIGNASSYLQWKAYSGTYNEKEEASGLVYTWTYVPYFREYALNNNDFGLCASVDANIYNAEAGDIIHVGPTGPTRHAMVSIGPYVKNGQVLDILVNSNTVDLEKFPLSAYVYPYVSLIKIYGWNE